MPRGGPRPGAGRPRKTAGSQDIANAADLAKLTPLEYMLQILRDPAADPARRRDRMAQAAAPYLHKKAESPMGKKEVARDKAAEAGRGKFAAGQAPKLIKFSRK